MNENHIKKIEELSINAWPSYKIELFDKWIIRFSHQYTYRTNCVEQIGPSSIPIEDKVSYCEDVYARFHTLCNFKINPIMDPLFDKYLDIKGYSIKHETNVMTMSLNNFISTIPYEEHPDHVNCGNDITVNVDDHITDEWINQLFNLNGTTNPTHLRIVPSMFKAIPKKTIVTSIKDNGRTVASGLGILDRDDLGVYAIYVDEAYRKRHYARAICNTILTKGIKLGARYTYLQVVKYNDPAFNLYRSLGYQYDYAYWFRSKQVN